MHGTPARVLAQHLGRNLRFKGSPLCEHPAVKPTAPLSRHYPHNSRDSGSSLSFPGTTLIMHGTPARVLAQHLGSKFALQRQPSVRQAALEQLPTPMPFTTGSFRACASGSRTANNGVHQLSLRARKIM